MVGLVVVTSLLAGSTPAASQPGLSIPSGAWLGRVSFVSATGGISFDGEFELRSQRVVGTGHLKMSVLAGDGAAPIDAIAFGRGEQAPGPECTRVRLVYRLAPNTFRGVTRAQLVVEHLEPAS